MFKYQYDNKWLYALILSFLLALTHGCASLQFIANYDEPTDRALSELQHSTDNFIVGLLANAKSSENAFKNHDHWYKDADRQLRRLEFRVMSIPNNTQTEKLVANIRASILGDGKCSDNGNSLRDLHCLPDNVDLGPSRMALEIARRNINQAFRAALALELAKKP